VLEGASELATKVRNLVGNRLDILVANAGISKAARLEDHTIADFDNLFATNVRAPFFLVQQLLPILGAGSGVIVTKSLAARFSPGSPGEAGAPSLPAYAATRARWKRW
jgi:NAD(P)-dependent dehydrogenase (short-subunit alcohol dehydrogenase family)